MSDGFWSGIEHDAFLRFMRSLLLGQITVLLVLLACLMGAVIGRLA